MKLQPGLTLFCCILLAHVLNVQAGELDSPAPVDDDASRLPGLEDIYQRLSTGAGESNPTGPFKNPVSGPGPTGYTLQQVMDVAPQPDNAAGAGLPDVLAGKTFWGLRTDGTWGLQTGAMPDAGQQNIMPGIIDKPIDPGYHNGLGRVWGDADLVPSSIRQGIDLFNVTGTLVPSGGTATPNDVAEGKTFYGLNQSNWVLQVGTAGSFTCDPGFYDLNGWAGDECEFELDTDGIYVMTATDGGSFAGDCGIDPFTACATVTLGLDRAKALGRSTVHVANGVYYESLLLAEGVSLLGGYDPVVWTRDAALALTIIREDGSGLHRKTISAIDVNASTLIDGFIIFGGHATAPGKNSYAVWLLDSPGVTLANNQIHAGDGADGSDGTHGSDGLDGTDGSPGANAYGTSYDCYETCLGNGESAGGFGGSRSCGGTEVSGGPGATAQCPDWHEGNNNCSSCSVPGSQSTPPAGSAGLFGGGAGGASGFDGIQDDNCGSLLECVVTLPANINVAYPMSAENGSDGVNGNNGNGGAACVAINGTVLSGEWTGDDGTDGVAGVDGAGGGGGGAGGGVEASGLVCTDGGSDIGGSGGGGGSAGCSGNAGVRGDPGGGSFAVFVVFTEPPVSVPTIEHNVIYKGNGGRGGSGGFGGVGGAGGSGAMGGAGGVPGSAFWSASAGGAGGDGGAGGHGGGGGGGCGGVAFGIYSFGQGGANLSPWLTNNTYPASGSPGAGGAGGLSLGNPGEAGPSGGAGDTNF